MHYPARGKVPANSSQEGSSKQPVGSRQVWDYFFSNPSYAPSPASSQKSKDSTGPDINRAPTNEITSRIRLSNIPRSPTRQRPGTAKAKFRWIKGELIGKGSHGKVYMGLNVNTGQVMAVKQVELPQTAIDRMKHEMKIIAEALRDERETLKDLDHEHIVQYFGYEENEETLNIFLQYVSGGTIGSCLKQYGKFDEQVTKYFTRQILKGLVYLHDRGIIHRDLKSDNILVEESGVCKLSDFGISKKLAELKNRAYSMQGTSYWMAPEVYQGAGYDSKVDIWSVGCVVLEMWTAKRPWHGFQWLELISKFASDPSPPPVTDDCYLSPAAEEFRKRCFQLDPKTRPTASDLQDDSYLQIPDGWTFPGMSNMGSRGIIGPSETRRLTKMQSAYDVKKASTDLSNRFGGSLNLDFPRDGQGTSSIAEGMKTGIRKGMPSLTHRASFQVSVPRGPSPPLVTIQPPGPRRQETRRASDWMERQRSTSAASDSSGSQRSTQSASRPPRRLMVYNPDADRVEGPEKQPVAPQSDSYIFEPQPLPAVDATAHRAQLLPPIRSQSYGPDSIMNAPIPNAASRSNVANRHLSYSESESSYSSSTGSIWKKPPKHYSSVKEALRSSNIGDTRPAIGDVLRSLDTYFPDHDLDTPIVRSPTEHVSSVRHTMKSVKAIAEENRGISSSARQTRLWDSQVEEIKAPR